MTRRRWLLLLALVALAAYGIAQEAILIRHQAPDDPLLDFAVGMAAVVAGLVALDQRPGNRIGWILVAIGAVWFAAPYAWLGVPPVTIAATLATALHVPLVGHLVLAYPSGRLQTRFERVLVVLMYAVTLCVALARMAVFDPRAWGCDGCVWQPAIWPDEQVYEAVNRVGEVTIWLLSGAFVVAVVLRYARSSRIERRDLMPLWVGAGLLAVIEVLGSAEGLAGTDFLAFVWRVRAVLLTCVPLVFLYGLLTTRTARSAIGDLVLRLERGVAPGQLEPVLAECLGDPSLRVVYATDAQDGWVGVDGSVVTHLASVEDRNHATTVIERDGRPHAALIHDRALGETLVRGVASAAAMALENEWLHAELRAQLAEVRASRARIVEAGDAERRRVERDLHDGAQQRLLAASLAVRSAKRQAARAAADASVLAALGDAEAELKEAITELRELARGLHPTILTDQGLSAALQALALRSTVPVILDVDVPERLPAAVEAAAYFAVSESLANVAKHAGGDGATVRARVEDGFLRVEVRDTGRGGADPAAGTGLRGLRDRVAAAEGTLAVTSLPGRGTTVGIELPIPGLPAPEPPARVAQPLP